MLIEIAQLDKTRNIYIPPFSLSPLDDAEELGCAPFGECVDKTRRGSLSQTYFSHIQRGMDTSHMSFSVGFVSLPLFVPSRRKCFSLCANDGMRLSGKSKQTSNITFKQESVHDLKQ